MAFDPRWISVRSPAARRSRPADEVRQPPPRIANKDLTSADLEVFSVEEMISLLKEEIGCGDGESMSEDIDRYWRKKAYVDPWLGLGFDQWKISDTGLKTLVRTMLRLKESSEAQKSTAFKG